MRMTYRSFFERYHVLVLCLVLCTASVESAVDSTESWGWTRREVLPKTTDPAITQYLEKHVGYMPSGSRYQGWMKGQLFVFLHGRGLLPTASENILKYGVEQGFHTLGLRHPDPVIPRHSVCAVKDCISLCRFEICFSGNTTSFISVNGSECIENRLVKALLYMNKTYPTDNWGQYIDGTVEPVGVLWHKIRIGGHSQGGGNALMIAKYRPVASVTMYASSGDYYPSTDKIAPWYADTKYTAWATPVWKIFGFGHVDDTDLTWDVIKQVWDALQVFKIGVVKLMNETEHYAPSHAVLATADPAISGAMAAHMSVVVDSYEPKDTVTGRPIYESVWNYVQFGDFKQPEIASCPAGFVRVPARAEYGGAEFCAAKYLMKIKGEQNGSIAYDSSYIPDSRPDGTPWKLINRDQAKSACEGMGEGYALMSNNEWMAIARDIEDVADNWSDQTAHPSLNTSAQINVGHSCRTENDWCRAMSIAKFGRELESSSDDNDACYGYFDVTIGAKSFPAPVCSKTQWNLFRRTHKLSDGEWLWDFAGHLWEWIDMWVPYDKARTPGAEPDAYQDVNPCVGTPHMPEQSYVSVNKKLTRGVQHIGAYHPCPENVGGTLMRGGNYYHNRNDNGIYSIGMGYEPDVDPQKDLKCQVGFRCVYRGTLGDVSKISAASALRSSFSTLLLLFGSIFAFL